jgi:hypothetical protein
MWSLARAACVLAFLSAVAAGPRAGAVDPKRPTPHRFKFTIESDLDMTIQGQAQKLTAHTELRYDWTRTGQERVLSVESLLTKVDQDGQSLLDSAMSRTQMTTVQNGVPQVIAFDDAPAELQTMLRDSFETPLCRLRVDATGQELERELVAAAGAKEMMDNGIVANATLFHAPFPVSAAEWQAKREVSMGNGGFANGELAYRKTNVGNDGHEVAVSGTLTNDNYQGPGNPLTIKDARYEVEGQQTFDAKLEEWIAGKWTLGVSFELDLAGTPLGSASGTMVVEFERLAAEQ